MVPLHIHDPFLSLQCSSSDPCTVKPPITKFSQGQTFVTTLEHGGRAESRQGTNLVTRDAIVPTGKCVRVQTLTTWFISTNIVRKPWAFTRSLVIQRMVFMLTFLYLWTNLAVSLISSIFAVRHTIAPLFLREALIFACTRKPGFIA